MSWLRRIFVMICAALGLATTSQAPEFAQQYRQRLGGAVEELKTVTEKFDQDARAETLSREQALDSMKRSNDSFSRRRGESMEEHINRYENLARQRDALVTAPPFLRPLEVLKGADSKVVDQAWDEFEPAIPLTGAGFIWGAIGGLLLGGFSLLTMRVVPKRKKENDDEWKPPKPVKSSIIAPRISREYPDEMGP